MTTNAQREETLVDLYRDVLKMKQDERAPLPPSTVPGTGRSCKPNRFVPGKRLKALHRSVGGKASLKTFAKMVSAGHFDRPVSKDDTRAAERWLDGKGVRP